MVAFTDSFVPVPRCADIAAVCALLILILSRGQIDGRSSGRVGHSLRLFVAKNKEQRRQLSLCSLFSSYSLYEA